MKDHTRPPIAERVRTILARGASGTVESGRLSRPLRSARVRDDGVVVLVVDVGREGSSVTAPGSTATVEILDSVCTGRCRSAGGRPSFALDGRTLAAAARCDDDCVVVRGVVGITGLVTAASSARRRRLVSADGGAVSGGDAGGLRLAELRPLEVTYLSAEGSYDVRRADLVAAPVDPVAVDEQEWLWRFAAETGLAARLAVRAGRQIAGTDPWVVAVDRYGLDVAFGSAGSVFPESARISFSQVCDGGEDLRREFAGLVEGA